MKLLGILKNILFEEKISNPIVDVNLNDYKIRFILSTHAQERMTRKENDSDITVDEIKSAATAAVAAAISVVKGLVATKMGDSESAATIK